MRSFIIILISFFFILSCGSSKKEGPDYNQMTDSELIQLANKKMSAGHYKEAIKDYNRLLQDYPTSNLHIDAQLNIAEAYGKMDQFEKQMDLLYRLIEENIIPDAVPRIEVQIGKFYERAAQFNPGIRSNDSLDYKKASKFYKMAMQYQDSKDKNAKAEATYRKAMVDIKTGQYDAARSSLQKTIDMFPNSTFSILAQIKILNPEDKTELAASDSAMAVYREKLGIVPPSSEEKMPESEIITPTTIPVQSDSSNSVNQIIDDATEDNSQQNENTLDTAPVDSSGIK